METYLYSFVFVSVVLGFSYAIMRVLSKTAGDDNKKKTIYFIIFFIICTFFYSTWEDEQRKYNEQIQDYLYKIEQANNQIYDELENTDLLFDVEDSLFDINNYIQEIYYIMNS